MSARVWLGVLALAVAGCGGGDADRQAATREALEEEFGRREEPAAPARDASPPSGTPSATPSEDPLAAPGGREGEPDAAGRNPPAAGGGDPAPPPGPPAAAPTGRADTVSESPVPGSPAGIDVDSLLAGAEGAYSGLRSLRASFTQRTENRLLERTREGTGRWYQAGRDRFLMDFTDPPDDAYVADGTFLWVYQPSATPGQVIKSELARSGGDTGTADLLGQILREARTAYDGVYAGRESVSGVDTHHVVLTPLGRSSYVHVDVWIASRDRLVRRFRIEEENETIRTVTLADLEPNVPLADSLFRFTPPPGVTTFTP